MGAENWIRSSRCSPEGNCVELRRGLTEVIVRDSKGAASAILTFAAAGPWSSFMEHCRAAH